MLIDHGLAMVAATMPISYPKKADDVHAMLIDVERRYMISEVSNIGIMTDRNAAEIGMLRRE